MKQSLLVLFFSTIAVSSAFAGVEQCILSGNGHVVTASGASFTMQAIGQFQFFNNSFMEVQCAMKKHPLEGHDETKFLGSLDNCIIQVRGSRVCRGEQCPESTKLPPVTIGFRGTSQDVLIFDASVPYADITPSSIDHKFGVSLSSGKSDAPTLFGMKPFESLRIDIVVGSGKVVVDLGNGFIGVSLVGLATTENTSGLCSPVPFDILETANMDTVYNPEFQGWARWFEVGLGPDEVLPLVPYSATSFTPVQLAEDVVLPVVAYPTPAAPPLPYHHSSDTSQYARQLCERGLDSMSRSVPVAIGWIGGCIFDYVVSPLVKSHREVMSSDIQIVDRVLHTRLALQSFVQPPTFAPKDVKTALGQLGLLSEAKEDQSTLSEDISADGFSRQQKQPNSTSKSVAPIDASITSYSAIIEPSGDGISDGLNDDGKNDDSIEGTSDDSSDGTSDESSDGMSKKSDSATSGDSKDVWGSTEGSSWSDTQSQSSLSSLASTMNNFVNNASGSSDKRSTKSSATDIIADVNDVVAITNVQNTTTPHNISVATGKPSIKSNATIIVAGINDAGDISNLQNTTTA